MSFPLFVSYNVSPVGLAHDIVPSLWEELRFRGVKESTLFGGVTSCYGRNGATSLDDAELA